MRFLFWNINNNPGLAAGVASLASALGSDVVALAENKVPDAAMLAALGGTFRKIPTPKSRVSLFTRLPAGRTGRVVAGRYWAICPLTTPAQGTVLLVVAHLASKLWASPATQRVAASDLAEAIGKRESALGTEKSVLIGDLKMDPFDPGMVEVQGLHAVSAATVATGVGRRRLGRKTYPMFYNPMWSHMGDGWRRPAGTYFFRSANVDRLYFHTVDQVLVRPALVPLLTSQSVRVVTHVGPHRFADAADDVPLKATASDHLPVHLDLPL